ncbi:MAG: hypothetical protein JSW28_03255 [Thermoplasmata archaeon]|nr:MAG: hypothetical protein JSW28_03255 [Thermoplasmata archaeon]
MGSYKYVVFLGLLPPTPNVFATNVFPEMGEVYLKGKVIVGADIGEEFA